MKVGEAIRMIEADWWKMHSQKGSHRQFKHSSKAGRVTVAGKPGADLHPKTLASGTTRKAERVETMQYAIVIEREPGSNYSAYAPDLPGCVAAGDTLDEIKRLMQEAIEFHIEGMRQDGLPIPEPSTSVALVEVAA